MLPLGEGERGSGTMATGIVAAERQRSYSRSAAKLAGDRDYC
jgi:hypothetical protein